MTDDELQARVNVLLAATDSPTALGQFSPFFGDGATRAGELAEKLRARATEDGLAAAVVSAEAAADAGSVALVKYALRVFITHEPLAREHLTLPLVEAEQTEAVDGQPPPAQPPPGGSLPFGIPGRPPVSRDGGTARVAMAPPPDDRPAGEDQQAVPSLTEPAVERAVDWYREDPFANDHHAHWHIVYPRSGGGVQQIQRRHGELFFYMHQQMLARYDTEREIAGLGPVVPYPPRNGDVPPDYSATIAEGYGSAGYTLRRPGRSFAEVPGAIEQCGRDHARLMEAIDERRLQFDGLDVGALNEGQLGAAAEASALRVTQGVISVDDVERLYGNLHGTGHGHVGGLGEGADPFGWGGVMYWTETAICDPFFYRWHRGIDDLYAAFQDATGERNDLATFAPADVSFAAEGPSIALCLSRDISGATAPSFDFGAWARASLGEALGGDPALLRAQLLTRFVRSRVTSGVPGTAQHPDSDSTYTTTHLVHEPFVYVVRLENAASQPRAVTLRVFLAHRDLAEERRAWIELDKFDARLEPGVNLLARPDARSSVIKRRGVSAPGAAVLDADAADQWCDCGWPYSLLLPSGASDAVGTPFRLLVCVTDHAQDVEPDHTPTCGSMSFCGALKNYPDKRNMGYPFDRAFRGSIADTIEAAPTMSAIDITIRCENPRPPE